MAQSELQFISEMARTGTRVFTLVNCFDGREVAWLNVTLAGVAIPPRARWIDSPGINDTEEMDFRAWQAARYSDVLFWIVSSRQPLAESEVAFLRRHVAERAGPASSPARRAPGTAARKRCRHSLCNSAGGVKGWIRRRLAPTDRTAMGRGTVR